ncbi:hypothetical protein GOBAR_DD19103 [Gossypium barbadense]|nr:hypothetical protein GOBAR_DD19103 [Gossypium barbadense]
MDQTQRSVAAAANSRTYQFHPARAAITDLFNLYLGVRNSRQKADDSVREPPNKTQKRVLALNRELPPRNEQFLLDFEQLQTQFGDQDQLQSVTESVLISLVIQCCSHAPRAEFLLFALRSLCSIGYVNWDTFLPSLLSSVASAEGPVSQGSQGVPSVSSSVSQSGMMPSTSVIANASNFQSANAASTLTSVHVIGSPAQSTIEPSSGATLSPVKLSNIACSGQPSTTRMDSSIRDNAISNLRQLCCKIILTGLECNLKPVTQAEIFHHMLNWLVNWDQRQHGNEECDGKSWRLEKALIEWLHSCLDVIWLLVEEDKCRVPFYELLRSGLQFIENIPDDEALFTLILEIHRRRDMMAMHMQMLDQHLHCPSFGTHRILSQTTPNVSVEGVANLRYSPITYPSVLGEPLHGEDLAASIQRGSLDWERALRCIRHAIRSTPSPDWWKRVLVVAPFYRGSVPTPEINCWQEWLVFSDIFFFLMKSGCIDFVDFIDKLGSRLSASDHHILNTNHVTWLLAQIIRVEHVMTALNTDSRKVETTRKILSFHREDRSSDPNNPQSILLDFISSCQNLRIWSLNTSTRDYLNNEQLQKGKQIDEWWRQVSKGERMMDYMSMDDKSIGMFWVVSYTMAQPACETVMNWLSSGGVTELLPGANVQPNERFMVMREVSPLPISLLSGFSMNLYLKLVFQMEESLFAGQVVPSIAMVETYTRLLLIAPHSLFRSHFSHLAQRNASLLSKPAVTLLVLEIVNYRLLPLYRLAENLCINLILSLRDFFSVKREGKGPTEFTETLNRITIITLAITIKTRGIADADHLLYLQTMLEQILATSQHRWSEKTLCYFPSILRDLLMTRTDKRGLAIQEWQQQLMVEHVLTFLQSETTVINQCTQLLSSSTEPNYVMTYLNRSFPQHRQYLCAGAWILMQGHPENINSGNLARVLREFSPEEVTSNIYTMVDVLLHHIHIELQHGHSLQISLLDRQELQQRVKLYCMNRGPPEHWLYTGIFKRSDLQNALGNHLSWKERYPTFFDDIVARLLPVIPLVVYRLIENDAIESADRMLGMYSLFLAYHPLRFTFVRDILAYFYGHLPGKLTVRILNVLDLSKIPFSESFPQHISSSNPAICPPPEYFATLLLALVNNVIPPLNSNSRTGSMGDASNNSVRGPHNKTPATPQSGPANASEGQKAFYQIQDPGTYTQLVLETAVIEILSLPISASQIVSSLVQIVVNIQPTLIQSSNGLHGASSGAVQGSVLPTSPSGGSTDSAGRSTPSVSGINTSSFVSRSGYTCQQLSCLFIQACGLLLAQLPPEFHLQLYMEASRIIKESWWLTDGKRSLSELDSAVSYALLDPTWASQDNTSTAIGNIVALLHSFFSNLPQEWLEGTHVIIQQLRPVTSVAMLRIAFRIMGPLLPRLVTAHNLFNKNVKGEYWRKKHMQIRVHEKHKVLEELEMSKRLGIDLKEILSLLLNTLVDVFGKNTQPPVPVEASEITDLIDYLHHIIHYEGQAGPVQANSKPRPEVLSICGRAAESLRPDVQHLLSHLKPDVNSSIYAATHPKIAQNPS